MGVFLLLAGMLVAFVSMDVLMKSAVLLHRYTFGSLLSYAFGPRSGVFLDLMLFLYGNGSLLTYFIFLGDFIPSIYLYFTGLTGTPVADRYSPEYAELRAHCLVAMFLLVFPVSLFRDLSAFKALSPIMLVAIGYTEILVLVTCVFSFHIDGWDWWQHLRRLQIHGPSLEASFSDFADVSRAFSISVFAYCCHLNVVPAAKELNNPQDRRIEKICLRVAYFQLIIYLLISVAGFLTFGDATPQNLLEAYSPENRFALVGRCLMALTVLVAVATNTNPTVRAGLCLLEVQVESIRDHDYGISPADLQKSPLQPRPSNGVADKPEPNTRRMVRYLLTLLCLFADMVIAVKVRDVANVVGLLGATMGNAMMMVIPLLLLYLLRNELYDRRWKTIGIAITLFLAGILAVASIFVPKS